MSMAAFSSVRKEMADFRDEISIHVSDTRVAAMDQTGEYLEYPVAHQPENHLNDLSLVKPLTHCSLTR